MACFDFALKVAWLSIQVLVDSKIRKAKYQRLSETRIDIPQASSRLWGGSVLTTRSVAGNCMYREVSESGIFEGSFLR